jgi:hypothetical protein
MRATLLGVGALAVVLAGCSGLSVNSDWDPGVDFSTYSTFAVLDEAPGESGQSSGLDALTRNRVKNAIATTLLGKGMRQVDNPEEADAAVGWQFSSEQKSSYQTVSTGWGGYGWGGYGGYGGWYGRGMGYGGGMSTSTTYETRYDVGTLFIALYDVERREMIFVGQGSKTLSDKQMSPEESQQRINEAVDKILADFPPGG